MKEIKNLQDFENIIAGSKPVLLDFYADWCGPCRAQLPIVEQLATKLEHEYEVAKVNVDHNKELAQHFSVRSIPSLFIIKDKEVKERLSGLQSEPVLLAKMKAYAN